MLVAGEDAAHDGARVPLPGNLRTVRVLSVNVGLPRELTHDGVTVRTAIVKEPVAGRVAVRRLNLNGDGQADLRVHGGPDKAVYAYPAAHYPRWRADLGRDDLAFGHFGENLTVEGADEAEVLMGDVYRAGSALLEVSQPRVPCAKLGIRMGDPGFLAPFLRSGRTGFYLRVIEEGDVAAGDPMTLEARGEGGLSVREAAALLDSSAAPEDLERAAAVPALAGGWREGFARRAAGRRRRAG